METRAQKQTIARETIALALTLISTHSTGEYEEVKQSLLHARSAINVGLPMAAKSALGAAMKQTRVNCNEDALRGALNRFATCAFDLL